MARDLILISQTIKADWMSQEALRSIYGWQEGSSFDSFYSAVSVERLMVLVVASSIWLVEQIVESLKRDIDHKISTQYVMSARWYWQKVLEYQDGDALQFDPVTLEFHYPEIVEEKKIVAYAAVREIKETGQPTELKILVSDKQKQPIEGYEDGFDYNLDTPINRLYHYLQTIKAAGVKIRLESHAATEIAFAVNIYYDPSILKSTGALVVDDKKLPIEQAISSYLNEMEYGGIASMSRMIDKIQAVPGVIDATYVGYRYDDGQWLPDARIEATKGAFVWNKEGSNLTYTAVV